MRNIFNKPFTKEFFDVYMLNKLLDEHFDGEKNNGRKIYTILAFLIWYEVYFIDNEQLQ